MGRGGGLRFGLLFVCIDPQIGKRVGNKTMRPGLVEGPLAAGVIAYSVGFIKQPSSSC